MEFLIVTYPAQRVVHVDGQMVGTTNQLLMLPTGRYSIDLGEPANYSPSSVAVVLSDTSPNTPYVVEFAAAGHQAAPPARMSYGFVAMDYSRKFLNRFHDGILPAAKAAGIAAVRTDQTFYTGSVLDQVLDQIANARLLIADVFPENPNVYIELGYGWGLKKPIVLLVNNPNKRPFNPSRLPFDIRQLRYLEYKNTADLHKVLQDELTGLPLEKR